MRLKVILVLISLVTGAALPQYVSPSFEFISIQQGFLQSSVNCIMQDSRGFIWFGTNDGLARYDGYSFKTYRNVPGDTTSVSGNNITAITEDKWGYIWIGTSSGMINMFNPVRQKFLRYKLLVHPLFTYTSVPADIPSCYSSYTANTITSLMADTAGYVWAGTFGLGLFQLQPVTYAVTHYYYTRGENSVSSNYILSLAEGDKDDIWIGTAGSGLCRMTGGKYSFNPAEFHFYFNNYPGRQNKISSLVKHGKFLWAGIFGRGVVKLSLMKEPADSLFIPAGNNDFISTLNVTSMAFDNKNNLWIGTAGQGLVKYDEKKNFIHVFRKDPFSSNSIANNDVSALYADNNGIIWIAALNSYTINKLNPAQVVLPHINSDPSDPGALKDNFITSFAEDIDGNIWTGTINGGLNKLDKNGRLSASYINIKNDPASISSNYITCIFIDNKQRIWAGTFSDGLNLLIPGSNVFKRYTVTSKDGYVKNRITSITQDVYGNIWIGTADAGLLKVRDIGKGNFRFTSYENSNVFPGIIPENNITRIFNDSENKVRILTRSGFLCSYNIHNDEFSSVRLLKDMPDISVISALADDNIIFLGTNSGLFRCNENSGKVTAADNIHKLKYTGISNIVKHKNDLWLTTAGGIIRVNLLNNTTVSFNLSNGLQSLNFNPGAAYKTRDNKIYFGGSNGFNSFYPDSIVMPRPANRIFITSFSASGTEMPVFSNNVNLPAERNSLLIEFTSNDFSDPSKNEFLYLLSGYDKEWKYLSGNGHAVSYNDLPSGSYVLKVKGANSAGVWTSSPLVLYIHIAPVFWKTWWFILGSILIAAAAAFYFVYLRITRYLEVEKLKARLSADLHDSVGSGLTEISLLSEVIKRDSGNTPAVETISARARELVDNMSDIVWLVNPKPNTLYELVIRLKEIYYPLCCSIGIKFKVEIAESLEHIKLSMEKRQNIYLIFKEGINNSIKYSKADNINLSVDVEEKNLVILLKDNGSGFNAGSVTGNGLNNMKKRAASINAYFEIKSTPGEGTRIHLTTTI